MTAERKTGIIRRLLGMEKGRKVEREMNDKGSFERGVEERREHLKGRLKDFKGKLGKKGDMK